MKTPPLVTVMIFSCCVAMAQQNQAQYPAEISLGHASSQTSSHNGMTVPDVIRLTKAGISDDIIIQQLSKNGQRTNLSTDQLVQLKNGGVSDRVIRAMINPSAPAPETTAPRQAVTPSPAQAAPSTTPIRAPATTVPVPTPALSPVASTNTPTSMPPPETPNDGKVRVYVSDRPITEVISMIQGGRMGLHMHRDTPTATRHRIPPRRNRVPM